MRIGALVLAGGASRRMGRNKLQLPQQRETNVTILNHVTSVAQQVADKVLILAAKTDCNFVDGDVLDGGVGSRVSIHRDDIPFLGPLYALHRAWPLLEGYDLVFLIAGDLPGLSTLVLNACRQRLLRAEAGLDGVVVKRNGYVQPLLGCYRQSAGRVIEEVVELGDNRLMSVVTRLQLESIDAEREKWPDWFAKPVHTPEDYEVWLDVAAEVMAYETRNSY